MRCKIGDGDCGKPSRQRCQDHDQAHGLIEDDGLKREEAEQPDRQREPELCTAEPNHPTKKADSSTCGEREQGGPTKRDPRHGLLGIHDQERTAQM